MPRSLVFAPVNEQIVAKIFFAATPGAEILRICTFYAHHEGEKFPIAAEHEIQRQFFSIFSNPFFVQLSNFLHYWWENYLQLQQVSEGKMNSCGLNKPFPLTLLPHKKQYKCSHLDCKDYLQAEQLW